MKKVYLFLLLVISIFMVGCNKVKEESINLVVPKGIPYITVGNLTNEKDIVNVDAVNGVLGVKTAFVQNKADIVIAPVNLGVQLYTKNNSKYILDSVIALANNYIVSKKSISLTTLNDLNGKTILAYGKSGTPGVILEYILKSNNIDVKVDYQEALTDVIPFFMQGKYDYILAAEPVISNLIINKKLELNILNLQDYTDTTIMQAGIFVNPETKSPKTVNKVISQIEHNIKEMKNETETYVDSIINNDVYFSDLTKEALVRAINNANYDYLKAKYNKANIEKYLDLIKYEKPSQEFYR